MTSSTPIARTEESAAVRLLRNKWLQSGLAGIPWAGGPVQAFLSNVVKEIDDRHWQEYWTSVESRLQELDQTMIDASYFSSEDFVLRLRRIHSEVLTGADETKLRYLRDYLVACATHPAFDTTWKDLFLRCLQEMTGSHLLVLQRFYDMQHRLAHTDRFELPQRVPNSPVTVGDLLSELEGAEPLLLEMIAADLAARGLVSRWMGAPLEPVSWSITDSGLRLMEFLQA